jgi:hypothetical protein
MWEFGQHHPLAVAATTEVREKMTRLVGSAPCYELPPLLHELLVQPVGPMKRYGGEANRAFSHIVRKLISRQIGHPKVLA